MTGYSRAQHIQNEDRHACLAAAALAVVLYAVAGFVIAPKLIRSALLEDIPKTLGVKAAVGDIRINPFLLQVEVKDFALSSDGEKLLGFERLFIDFEFSSLWKRAYCFAKIELAAPYVNATVASGRNAEPAEAAAKIQAGAG